MSNKPVVPKSTLHKVETQVRRQLATMVPGRSYTLAAICGADFWHTLSKSERIAAGQYIRKLVTNAQLIMQPMGTNSSNKQLYRKQY